MPVTIPAFAPTSQLKMPSFNQTPNKLVGSNLLGTDARAGLGIATGGTSEIIAQVLNIVPSIFQGIVGARQLKQAKGIEADNPRPEAEIAPSINELVNYAKGRTLAQDIPGGEIARNEIKGATSAGIRAASELGSGAEAYGMLGQLVGREQNQFSELAKLTAQQVAGYEGDYMNTLGIKADEENRVWNWNEAQPYQYAAQTAQALRDSGMRNISAGVKNVFGSAAETVAPDFNSSLLMGNGGNAGSSFSSAQVKAMLDEIYKE